MRLIAFPRLLVLLAAGLATLTPSSGLGGNFYSGTSPATVPWPGGIVPYEFTNTLSDAMKQTYLDGLREWELAANVKFVPRTDQARWILFAYNTNGFNNVSTGYAPQVVSVSILSRSQVGHEMGHSFGFAHENIRPDQASYLTVLSNNVAPGFLVFFQIDPSSVTNGNYDFESVMHLGRDFASVQPGLLATQEPNPPYSPRYQYRMGNYALSPGDRAALRFLYGPPAVATTNVVTTTADSGPGSLRAAMYYVTDHPGAVVRFNIPTNDPGYSNGVFTIHLTGYLPPLVTNGTVIDGATQPGFSSQPLIVIDGSQMIPEAYGPGSATGLLIYSANNLIKNCSFQNFNWNGLTLRSADSTNNTIAGCWLGLDSTGSNAAPNIFQGIFIDTGASRNVIGGTTPLARNVISGNRQYGIWMSGSDTTGNVVLGNYIGTDAIGSVAVSNAAGGVILTGATHGNSIGGTNASARNVLSGNSSAGIWITGAGVDSNIVQGNFIGLNAGGATVLPNSFAGIFILSGAQGNLVANNVISGNRSEGVRLGDAGTSANLIQGNLIGTDATGLGAAPNGFLGVGIYAGATGNVIGGTTGGFRNVISGNNSEGVRLQGDGVTANVIQGNYIGTDASGLNPLGNNFAGLTIFSGAASNVVGGAIPGARNIISGNGAYGLAIANAGSSGNVIQGNYFGLGADGSVAVPNFYGVLLSDRASGNTVGGTTGAARNIISGNNGSGIFLTDAGTSANSIQGNYVGTDASGSIAVANEYEGIYIDHGAGGNLIGGVAAGAGNVISGNLLRGIYAYGTNTSGNWIQGNFIGTKGDGTNALGNGWDGIVFFNGASSNVVGLATDGSGAGNKIAFNGFTGVYVGSDNGDDSFGNTIRGNNIFSNGYIGINLAGGTENSSGVTANDPADADAGPNRLQNYPIITNAVASGSSTLVSGTLNSAANKTFLIDLYRSTSADPSGYGEGEVYLGSVTVNTSGSGAATFSLAASGNLSGQYLSATATDQGSGDTSEFNLAALATVAPTPPAFVAPINLTSAGFTAALSLNTGQSYRVQSTTNLAENPIQWVGLTNFVADSTNFIFLDRAATNHPMRFYRVVSP